VPTDRLRPLLARDGIFNVRDLGGLPTASGGVVAPRRLVRADALHRARASAPALAEFGITRVLDLRDQRELDAEGSLEVAGVVVEHHRVLDPTFRWSEDGGTGSDGEGVPLLARRYRVILGEFAPRFAGALTSMAEEYERPDGGAVAVHCAVGKDRTGLLTMLVLGLLEVPDEVVVADYARSAAATAVQVSWLWSLGRPGGDATDEDLHDGVWSARAGTMDATLRWLRDTYGGIDGYLDHAGVSDEVRRALRSALVLDPRDGDDGR
jgi:protein-tyrosine phosphatase